MTKPSIEVIPVGPLEVNCYLVSCPVTQHAAVIDPGAESPYIISTIEGLGLRPKMILNTHAHLDHIANNADLVEHFHIPVMLHRDDLFLLTVEDIFGLASLLHSRPSPAPARLLADGEVIEVGQLKIAVLHTPGHTPGSCCFLLDNICFTGDTVFAGSVGRTDLPGGDYDLLIRSLSEKIRTLPGSTQLLPGHGPATTVDDEVRTNPFFR